VMTGHRSVYPSQVLAVEKSRFIEATLGKEVEEVEAHLRPGSGSVRGKLAEIGRAMREKARGKKDQ
jgi:hypothetical protein